MTRVTPHGKNLRVGRRSIAGQAYLITASTWQRQLLFEDLFVGRMVVRAFAFQHQQGNVEGHAFVVMPDHFHWLITLADQRSLSDVMRAVKAWSSRAINEARGTKGEPVWQRGYHDRAMRREDDLLHAARYIVANPLRAGLVDGVGDYSLWDAEWL